MKDPFGSFLQEANSEIYGTKISTVEFKELLGNGLKLEWALRKDDLIIHIYKADNMKWPLTYAKHLYKIMDEHASGEERDIGYEDMVDSWYIKSEGFGKSKLAPNMAAQALCQRILKNLESLSN